jgi:hypothetical protein
VSSSMKLLHNEACLLYIIACKPSQQIKLIVTLHSIIALKLSRASSMQSVQTKINH